MGSRSGVLRAAPVAAALLLGLVASGCEQEPDDEPSITTSAAAVPAELTIRPVIAEVADGSVESSHADGVVRKEPGSDEWLDLGPIRLESADVARAKAEQHRMAEGWQVEVTFTDRGNTKFGDLTEKAACKTDPANRIAILVDEVILSAPVVEITCGARMDDGTQISGNFSQAEAEQLAARINQGR